MASLFPRWPGLRLLTGSTLFNLASGCYTITLGQALFAPGGALTDQDIWNTREMHAAEVPAAAG